MGLGEDKRVTTAAEGREGAVWAGLDGAEVQDIGVTWAGMQGL